MKKRYLLMGFIFCLSIWFLTEHTKLLISATPSLPQKVFFMVKGKHATKGDLAGISGHSTAYFPDETIYIKRIVGIAGDSISRKEDAIEINLKSVGILNTKTENGHTLTSIKPQLIPKGYVFVVATHPRSFDSRYEEFGLIKTEHLLGKAWGLF